MSVTAATVQGYADLMRDVRHLAARAAPDLERPGPRHAFGNEDVVFVVPDNQLAMEAADA